jgi:hypothetical protein
VSGLRTDSSDRAGYEVAIAEHGGAAANWRVPGQGGPGGGVPGFEETRGSRKVSPGADSVLIKKGQAAVQAATDAIGAQIGATALRITEAVVAQGIPSPAQGDLGLESLEISFGVTLSAGLQTLFTAEAESSAQVTITLSRRVPDVTHTS